MRGNPNQQSQGNLNTSFSALNNSLSQKWAAINSGQKKIGGLTGRPQMQQSQSNLAQTMGPGGSNALNTSSNKFQSKMQGGFANRLQNKQSVNPPPQTQIGGGISHQHQANAQANNALNRSSNPGPGLSNNSFRSRLQGL